MLNRVPGGIAWPLITIADPSARFNGCRTWSKLAGAPGVERQNVPTVTRAGMPCRARAWRRALGSSRGDCGPLYRIRVVLPPGPLVTENAASLTGPGPGGGGLPERAGAGPPRVSVKAVAAPAVAA